MSKVTERAVARPEAEKDKTRNVPSIIAGALQGMVIGLQIALLAILGVIPASLYAALPGGDLFFQGFAMATGALAGATGAVAAITVRQERENRGQ
jgi:hypothetical protein